MQVPKIRFTDRATLIEIPRSPLEDQQGYKPGGFVAVDNASLELEEDKYYHPIWEYRLIGKQIHDWRWCEVARISAEAKLATAPINNTISEPIRLRPLLPDECYVPIPFEADTAKAA